jgi:hypothetical protein
LYSSDVLPARHSSRSALIGLAFMLSHPSVECAGFAGSYKKSKTRLGRHTEC